ncbi:MAG TPA: hypothetical protein VFO71_07675 [Gemmatimonadales bacterium]|nr:hypothetical protein [Gemmatimonadales bacterium]
MASLIRNSLILTLIFVAACAGRSQDPEPEPSGAVVQVQNQGFSDMVIYAVSGGQRIRLGLATGNSTRSFTVPRHLVRGAGPVRFLADPIGGNRTPVSEELIVEPGDVVTLTIPPQ